VGPRSDQGIGSEDELRAVQEEEVFDRPHHLAVVGSHHRGGVNGEVRDVEGVQEVEGAPVDGSPREVRGMRNCQREPTRGDTHLTDKCFGFIDAADLS
jgi:hypothetical protein